MDFFNTAFWAHRPGAYGVWHTVYPPLSFVFLRLWTAPGCYRLDPYAARACDIGALAPMALIYLVNAGLAFLSFRRLDRSTALSRAFALCAGAPMLYGLELANLIIPCFTVFVLAEGGLLRSPALRGLMMAVSINFKPYLLLTMLPRLVQRRWGLLLGVGACGLAIYGVTFNLEGAGSPSDLFKDLFGYAGGMGGEYAQRNHLQAIAASSGGAWALFMPALIRLGQVAALACFALAAISRPALDIRRLTALALTLVSSEAALRTQGYSADYTQIFLLFLVFMEPWETAPGAVMLVCGYLLCVCADGMLVPAVHVVSRSFLGVRTVAFDVGLMVSQFVRPALLLGVQAGLIALALREAKPLWFAVIKASA